MTAIVTPDSNILGVGRNVLHSLRRSLSRGLGDQAAACLQEAGYSAGEQIYDSFLQWLPEYTGISDPAELDATTLGEVLSAFFDALGWGRLTVERSGKAALKITSSNWAEAEPGAGAEIPSCFMASGLFAGFLGRMSGTLVGVMEVDCRTRGDEHCRFIVGPPDTIEAVFDALAEGSDYESALPA